MNTTTPIIKTFPVYIPGTPELWREIASIFSKTLDAYAVNSVEWKARYCGLCYAYQKLWHELHAIESDEIFTGNEFYVAERDFELNSTRFSAENWFPYSYYTPDTNRVQAAMEIADELERRAKGQ